ncbi:MAG TPA: hypothetical protein VIT24_09620 [Acidimicrobiales bacterium]
MEYEIRIEGHLDPRWAAWFDGLSLTSEDDGTTTIQGSVVDQAALHGVLQRLRDLGMPLISAIQIQPPTIPGET